jgi:hypothetical protein
MRSVLWRDAGSGHAASGGLPPAAQYPEADVCSRNFAAITAMVRW